MPRRGRWGDEAGGSSGSGSGSGSGFGWQQFPASKPLPADGLVTSKQRGAMAESWWSQRFIAVLESYGLGGRMQRGRRYARTGQVLDLDVRPGLVAAQVQGSRPTPYLVTVTLAEPTARQWAKVEAAMSSKIGFVARLLAGEVPAELEDVFADAGVTLFPASWRDLRAACNCPDWGDPCKHVAAVLYVLADQLDTDPWLLLAWRGRTRDEILTRLGVAGAARSRGAHGPDGADAEHAEVAPWWPFGPGPLPALPPSGRGPVEVAAAPPERPDAVLAALEPVDIEVAGVALAEVLGPIYDVITAGEPLAADAIAAERKQELGPARTKQEGTKT